MNRRRRSAVPALLIALAACALLAQEPTAGTGAETRMTAKKYEFDPPAIRVKTGDHVKLVITALDKEHGFKIEPLHINQKLPKGEPVTVEFTAPAPGTYPFECSHFCGFGHGKMKGELIVE